MEIVQIVPRFTPTFCGVGDYARHLARSLQTFGVSTRFIVTDPAWSGDAICDACPVEHLRSRDANSLIELLSEKHSSTQILLHYVGYGYDNNGCPEWLVDALVQWKRLQPQHQLTTMFHELYAIGRPWTKAFWTSRRQQSIMVRLATLSDNSRTNMQQRANCLGDRTQGRVQNLSVAPVFSTVGEPTTVLPLDQRSRKLVVFGGKASRQIAYTQHRQSLVTACDALSIDQIIDIGHPVDLDLSLPVEISHRGPLPSEEVSSLLSSSTAGFLAYSPKELGKSTIFAAYSAHGLLSIVVGNSSANEDGLIPGSHYWTPEQNIKETRLAHLQGIANAAREWYQAHSLPAQAKEVADQFHGKRSPSQPDS